MNKITNIIAYFIYMYIARYLPRSGARISLGSKRIRYFLCKRLFKKIGNNANIERMATFGFGDHIELGNNSGLGVGCDVSHAVIGNNVMMGPELLYISRGHIYKKLDVPILLQGVTDSKPLIIEDDVWIGARVIILPGIKIGQGAIVGAGSVITKNVPSYSVVAGNPARIIKSRRDKQ
ncbi:MAG: DapH/DapD/GlmU-related protein [Candidatus Kariarchaeaceae archaeon]|jgi:maltose O-acetyltransferase